uniref:ribosomal protein S3 n=1 Tax=Pallidohirschioporus biformis TaxID=50381 RepID=UPI002E779E37|nr:ribosomal protein S3 [Pallidohirschioporus biformis]WQA11111.1 ribosomal protein S3 [Pallidohirschioporus biformis]
MTYLKKNQAYDIIPSALPVGVVAGSNKIDILKNINKTFPNGLNFKELSLVEYESLITGKKLNHNSVSLPSGSAVGAGSVEAPAHYAVSQCPPHGGAGRGVKIAKLFSRYVTFSGYKANNISQPTSLVGMVSAPSLLRTAAGEGSHNTQLLSYQLNNSISTSGLSGLGVNNRSYINSLTAARAIAFQSQDNKTNIKYENFQFKKATYNKFIFAMEKATNLLNLAFKSSGCLISKPLFTIAYKGSGSAAISKGRGYAAVARLAGCLTHGSIGDGLTLKSNPSLGLDSKFKVNIHLFYYIKKEYKHNTASHLPSLLHTAAVHSSQGVYTNILSVINDKLLYLSDYLTKLFNTDIEIELVRLYKPYQDSNILVQQLNSESYNKKFIKIISRLFKTINIQSSPASAEMLKEEDKNSNLNNILGYKAGNNVSFPSRISGLNIKLAGRTAKERVIPRLTVKRAQRGTLNRLNAKLIEKSMFTDKSRKGAFNFTVTLSHIFK